MRADFTASLSALYIAFHLFGVNNSKISNGLIKNITFANISRNAGASPTRARYELHTLRYVSNPALSSEFKSKEPFISLNCLQ